MTNPPSSTRDDARPATTVLESGWRPAPVPATPVEAALADAIGQLLPSVRHLLWNVRPDMDAVTFGELVAERMRTLGTARMWRQAAELHAQIAAARARERC